MFHLNKLTPSSNMKRTAKKLADAQRKTRKIVAGEREFTKAYPEDVPPVKVIKP